MRHIDATIGALVHWSIGLSCYPFCDLSEHLPTGNDFLLDFELAGQTSFVYQLASSLIKIMVSQ